jgi:hypothetical protein
MKVGVLLLAVVFASASAVPSSAPPPPATPVLVELFTSEGCSSCPPADQLLTKLLREQPVAGVQIIPLSLHVDYWDRQGWRDQFSSAAYTSRQQGYSQIFGDDKVYTPQMVVDGHDEFIGSDEAAARRILAGAAARPHLPLSLDAQAGPEGVKMSIDLPAAPANAEPIDVLVALTEDDLSTVVRAGENGGRTLSHVAVVRKLQTMGALEQETFVASGKMSLGRTWKPAKMRAVVWLQGRKSRHVYGTAAAPLVR